MKLAFLFPGQGSQRIGMGRDLYESSSLAQEIFERADETLGFKISKICFDGPEEKLNLTQNTQPALLVVSYIVYSLLGKEPVMGAGHSLGEYSALVAAGSLRFEDAVVLVYKRGVYMQEAVPVGVGCMAAVLGSDYRDVEKALEKVDRGVVQIANWNSREQIVIAGNKQAVEKALSLINPPRSMMLPVSAPFHCKLMKSAEEKLAQDLEQVEFSNLKFPIVTNSGVKIIHSGRDAKDALRKQVSCPVRWYESMEVLRKEKIDLFVELGAGKVLSRLLKRIGRSWPSSPEVLNVEDSKTLDNIRKISG